MGYLAVAYLLVWTLIFFYLLFLQRRQGRLYDQLRALTRAGGKE